MRGIHIQRVHLKQYHFSCYLSIIVYNNFDNFDYFALTINKFLYVHFACTVTMEWIDVL